MAKAKRKTLPKDFDQMLKKGNLEELKAVFGLCDINAHAGYGKETALNFYDCPPELARWMVAQGADPNAGDNYGRTPLHKHARVGGELVPVLIELGADVNARENSGETPLHSAADGQYAETARLLIEAGADVNAANCEDVTPLDYALRRSRNADLEDLAPLAELLLAKGATTSPQTKEFVAERGQDFEFHRASFDKKSVKAASEALQKLYALFDVSPEPVRVTYDGKSPIKPKGKTWQKQHEELWQLLVPSSGHASTAQGEVIRIAGRIADEMERNGGANWDIGFRKMADMFATLVQQGKPLPQELLDEVGELVTNIKNEEGDTDRLAELGVDWVRLNPNPIAMAKPPYNR